MEWFLLKGRQEEHSTSAFGPLPLLQNGWPGQRRRTPKNWLAESKGTPALKGQEGNYSRTDAEQQRNQWELTRDKGIYWITAGHRSPRSSLFLAIRFPTSDRALGRRRCTSWHRPSAGIRLNEFSSVTTPPAPNCVWLSEFLLESASWLLAT